MRARTSCACPASHRRRWASQVHVHLRRSGGFINALLGTGFVGEPRGAIAEAIEAGQRLRRARRQRGRALGGGCLHRAWWGGRAVRAAMTVTFHAAKPGLWIHPGKAHAGEVRHARHRHPPRRAHRRQHRPDRECRAELAPAPHRRLDEVLGADTCSSPAARAASPAHRAWPPRLRCAPGRARHRLRARFGADDPRQRRAPRADDPRFARRGWRAHQRGRRCCWLEAAQRGGALALGPGLGRGPGAFRVCARARPVARPSRL